MSPVTPSHAASPALLALRRGVTIFGVVFALAIATQALVFGFVHFTAARYTDTGVSAAAPVDEKALQVVETPAKKRISLEEAIKDEPEKARKLGAGDSLLRGVSDTACAVGLIAAFVLLAQSWMSVVVASVAAIVGSQRAVLGASIITALFAMAVPWSSAVPATSVTGLLCGYTPTILASEAGKSGVRSEAVVVLIHGVTPMVALGLLVWAISSIRLGIAAGILLHTIDPVIEAELAAVRERGAGSVYGTRAAGDFDRAISAPAPIRTEPVVPPAPRAEPLRIAGDNETERAMKELEKLSPKRRATDEPLRPTGTDPLRRPI
ncbi:MAG: hypothetical protein K2Y21_04905 [Phycisphaerales bacterium]|nr:hypothetical protein [Phycisphaerales bacterium]